MIRIAVTGGFCSGKSSVTRFFGERGCPCLDCDRIVRDDLYRDERVAAEACAILGEDVIDARAGTIDSRRIWRIFFEDAGRKKRLEDFIHPLVFGRLRSGFEGLAAEGHAAAVAEVPLLTADMDLFDVVVLAVSDIELVVERAARRGYPSGLTQAVLSVQPDWKTRALIADYVVWNNLTVSSLQRRTDEIYDALMLRNGDG